MPLNSYSREEIASRAREIYERDLRPKLEAGNQGKILVIDIETGDYELDTDHLAANARARAKHPEAVLFGLRIGSPTLAKVGGRVQLAGE